MKRKLLSMLFLIAFCNNSNSQVLDVLKAIGGDLLPKVVDGFKDVKNSGNSNRVKYSREEFEKNLENLKEYALNIASSISDDANNLEVLGKISSRASQFYDDLGALESFSNGDLIDAVVKSSNEYVQRQFAYSFDKDLHQLKQDIDGVKTSILSQSIDQSLKDSMTRLIDNIKGEFGDFESEIIQSGVKRPTANTKIDHIKNYLISIKKSHNNVRELKRSIQEMISTLNSRLSSFTIESKKVQEKVSNKFKELSNK